MISAYHTKYFAHELTRRCPPDSVEKLAGALVDAQVDLNPHQVDAALFAFNSPLSKGALLADEVGLGKTIEAGLVLSQKWAERKRRILVITPSNLRKQWFQELAEKFFLPCRILEAKPYNAAIRQGQFRPFEVPEIVICSYQFAKSKAGDVQAVPWDLVVIDEAHRLRNVYKSSNVIANTLKQALAGKHKLLLTATPLQNSLLELFGLVSFVDEHAFGDLKSFREQFANLNQEQVFQTLKARLKPVCHRTLRRQVTAYIPYTKRLPLVEEFTPEESEDRLYHLVSEYLQRDNLQALPASQRSLMTLVLRKLLASSTFAIAGALTSISNRLKSKLRKQPVLDGAESLEDELDQDYEALDETAEEWTDDEPVEFMTEGDRRALVQEIADLDAFAQLAASIEHNAKGKGEVKSGFKPFTLDLSALKYPAVSDELWIQHLRTNQLEVVSVGRGGIEEARLEDYVVSGLVDFDDVSYDEHPDLLYDLAAQTVQHFKGYLSEEDIRKVLRCYQRDIARFIHAQMQAHYWVDVAGYEVKVSKGFTELKQSAYTYSVQEPPANYRVEPTDKSNMAKYLFGGFQKCLYPVQKFDSDSERKLAVILEREARKWFKPAKGQFQIYYQNGADHLEYQPDFVAETAATIYMLEPKKRTEIEDPIVIAKKEAAVKWCANASDYAASYGGKPWRYVLIPHDEIAENITLDGLAARFGG
ncbi:MAG: DEAD/DEAH box helicase [Azonexus sp.]